MSEENKPDDDKKYIINPKDVSDKDDMRARLWAASIMKRHESKLNSRCIDKYIIASGEVTPEEIDVMNIYPFPDLHWFIYRDGDLFALTLISGTGNRQRLLFTSHFAKI